jgi:1-acyl-sn-glycerol-3-phosphate acyltransferase
LKVSTFLQSMVLAPARILYALWALVAFLVLGLSALLLLLVLPRLAQRRAAARYAAGLLLKVIGMPLTVRFPERLPASQCVVVCNHASYIDGIVLTAALPARFGFVIKREMAQVPLAGSVLKRLGSEFVERFDRHRGASDARRVLRNAGQGHSLVFFPEGTFTLTPGLLKFHTGAFVTAARAGCAVVPAVVRGTRRALPASGGLPRPGRLQLEILPALIAPEGEAEHAAPGLRDEARARILAALGEPDLAHGEAAAARPGAPPAPSTDAGGG